MQVQLHLSRARNGGQAGTGGGDGSTQGRPQVLPQGCHALLVLQEACTPSTASCAGEFEGPRGLWGFCWACLDPAGACTLQMLAAWAGRAGGLSCGSLSRRDASTRECVRTHAQQQNSSSECLHSSSSPSQASCSMQSCLGLSCHLASQTHPALLEVKFRKHSVCSYSSSHSGLVPEPPAWMAACMSSKPKMWRSLFPVDPPWGVARVSTTKPSTSSKLSSPKPASSPGPVTRVGV